MSDVEVKIDGETFPAHKLILSQAPFFQTMFSSALGEAGTTTRPVIKLQQHGVTAAAFHVVLEFLYKVTTDPILPGGCSLLEVHTAARFFMLTTLEELCKDALAKALSVEVLVPYLRYAQLHELGDLKMLCLNYASESNARLGDLMATEDYISMVTEDRELHMELVEHLRGDGKKRRGS